MIFVLLLSFYSLSPFFLSLLLPPSLFGEAKLAVPAGHAMPALSLCPGWKEGPHLLSGGMDKAARSEGGREKRAGPARGRASSPCAPARGSLRERERERYRRAQKERAQACVFLVA